VLIFVERLVELPKELEGYPVSMVETGPVTALS
jgi:hypothetical protein